MTSFEELAQASFQIIAHVGDARSCYLEAISRANSGDYDGATKLMERGAEMFRKGHAAHAGLVQREAGGDPVSMTLMITHAEDQLMRLRPSASWPRSSSTCIAVWTASIGSASMHSVSCAK